ncbi:hypothetical protein ACFC1R_34875 [Kitasatospora sp. NPDC056138]|uniref:hypothetical protein n=1 Tax=Kitasatospora sp. NPDC056138 TaxID=3345724 RepID=UPI0035E392D0
MIRKLRRYAAYARASVWEGQRGTIGSTVPVWRRVYGRRLPRLLLVLDEEPGGQVNRRLDLIADALAAVEGTERWRIAAAPLKWVRDHGPAGRRIWRRPDDPQEVLARARL